jgi:hypothetical protein
MGAWHAARKKENCRKSTNILGTWLTFVLSMRPSISPGYMASIETFHGFGFSLYLSGRKRIANTVVYGFNLVFVGVQFIVGAVPGKN